MVSVSVNAYTGGVSKSGYYEGEGEARFKVGHRYVGGFKHGKMNGKGRYEWVDGIVFEGYFHDNVAEGHGVYTWPDGARPLEAPIHASAWTRLSLSLQRTKGTTS